MPNVVAQSCAQRDQRSDHFGVKPEGTSLVTVLGIGFHKGIVSIYIYMCIYIYIHTHTYKHIHIYIYRYTYTSTHTSCMHACMHACIHTYIHTYVYVYVSLYIYVCICIYTYIYVYGPNWVEKTDTVQGYVLSYYAVRVSFLLLFSLNRKHKNKKNVVSRLDTVYAFRG